MSQNLMNANCSDCRNPVWLTQSVSIITDDWESTDDCLQNSKLDLVWYRETELINLSFRDVLSCCCCCHAFTIRSTSQRNLLDEWRGESEMIAVIISSWQLIVAHCTPKTVCVCVCVYEREIQGAREGEGVRTRERLKLESLSVTPCN